MRGIRVPTFFYSQKSGQKVRRLHHSLTITFFEFEKWVASYVADVGCIISLKAIFLSLYQKINKERICFTKCLYRSDPFYILNHFSSSDKSGFSWMSFIQGTSPQSASGKYFVKCVFIIPAESAVISGAVTG